MDKLSFKNWTVGYSFLPAEKIKAKSQSVLCTSIVVKSSGAVFIKNIQAVWKLNNLCIPVFISVSARKRGKDYNSSLNVSQSSP